MLLLTMRASIASPFSMPSERIILRTRSVAKIRISEASAKIRTGPPGDDEEDLSLDIWAGVVPIATLPGEPIPAPNLSDGIANRIPESVGELIRAAQ